MTLGTLNRGQLMDSLRAIGLENPERHCLELEDEAIAGVVRWYRHASQQGQKIGGGLVVTKLRNGGLEGFGTAITHEHPWWRDSDTRWRWMENNVPDADPIYAEVAILQLVCKKQEPNAESVKRLAARLEREQAEYEESCKA